MRPPTPRPWFWLAPLLLGLVAPAVRADEPRPFEDATLHAVHFLDAREGWAVGDDGVVWHTNDAGANWERQSTGVSASLRSVCFLDPANGWAVGREELPHGGSVGVLLHTEDGGWTWKQSRVHALPGLHQVRFLSEAVGFLAGEGTDLFPTGLFQTRDAGRTWQPVPGPRCPLWLAADFDPTQKPADASPGGVLAGAWNHLALLSHGRVQRVKMDELGGRHLRGVQLRGRGGVAVGQGGLVLVSTDAERAVWGAAELKLPLALRAAWDFHAVHGTGAHVWVVGRPGSAALHSADGGRTWEVVPTGQPLPLNGLFFRDERNGWAVGELGTILATHDSGKTWVVQRRGGQRAAVLLAHARPGRVPVETVAWLGAREGYLTTGLCVTSPDSRSAALPRASDFCRFAAALRQAGGLTGETLWQFPIPAHLDPTDREQTVRGWDLLHADQAAEHVLRQLVLALRMWRPDVVLTDGLEATDASADTLVAEAVREAFRRAADPTAFPELTQLGLGPWKASKLYGISEKGVGPVLLDLNAFQPSLKASLRDFAAGPASLVGGTLPAERRYRLLASNLDGAEAHRDLLQGIHLAAGGLARRMLSPPEESSPEVLHTARLRANLRTLGEAPAGKLTDPNRLLGQIGPLLSELPDDQAAPAAHAIACQYVRAGQWDLARETFLLLADRYPTHPLALEALRWLIRHNASGEARRRHEMGQFLVVSRMEVVPPRKSGDTPSVLTLPRKDGESPASLPDVPNSHAHVTSELTMFSVKAETRQWYQGALEMESRLRTFGSLHAGDPAVQFCLQSARRNLGEFDKARQWYEEFATRFPDSPWCAVARAETWLVNRAGPPPRPVLLCRPADERPFLDGKLDEGCWQGGKGQRLAVAAGDVRLLEEQYPTEVRMAYDSEFLYLAARCAHPLGKGTEPARPRTRDGDLRRTDRISLLLDLDRDYATCFHLQVDASGCVAEDCWGDRTWDPRWFVAIQREPTAWTVEVAIPLIALSGDRVSSGRAWACNVLRTLPGRGVQALSLPADVPEKALRPEGMGLLLFGAEPRRLTQDDPGKR